MTESSQRWPISQDTADVSDGWRLNHPDIWARLDFARGEQIDFMLPQKLCDPFRLRYRDALGEITISPKEFGFFDKEDIARRCIQPVDVGGFWMWRHVPEPQIPVGMQHFFKDFLRRVHFLDSGTSHDVRAVCALRLWDDARRGVLPHLIVRTGKTLIEEFCAGGKAPSLIRISANCAVVEDPEL